MCADWWLGWQSPGRPGVAMCPQEGPIPCLPATGPSQSSVLRSPTLVEGRQQLRDESCGRPQCECAPRVVMRSCQSWVSVMTQRL